MPRRPRGAVTASAIASALVLLLALGGCTAVGDGGPGPGEAVAGGDRPPLDEIAVLDDPFGYVGESTALLTDAAIVPVEEHPAQSLPATVESAELGGPQSVTVTDTSRVLAIDLAGSLAATVWGLGFGSTLIGRDQSTTFPGAAELPLATSGAHAVSAEAVIAMRPTLIITDGTIGPRDVIEQLRDVGITVVFVAPESSFDGAAQLARDVAAIYGAPEAGERLAERTAADIAEAEATIDRIAPEPGLRMMFLYLRGGSGVYYLFGAESGANHLIEALGGVDVAGELGWAGSRPMTDEAVIAANPDLILVMTDGLASVGGVDGLLEEVPAIALTTAGQHRRFVDMADGEILSFGPRSAAVLDALARAIYAPDAT